MPLIADPDTLKFDADLPAYPYRSETRVITGI